MDAFTPQAFGQRLKSLLRLRRMSQLDFARRAGVCPTTVSKYVKGHAMPDALRVFLFADVLCCSTDHLRPDRAMPRN